MLLGVEAPLPAGAGCTARSRCASWRRGAQRLRGTGVPGAGQSAAIQAQNAAVAGLQRVFATPSAVFWGNEAGMNDFHSAFNEFKIPGWAPGWGSRTKTGFAFSSAWLAAGPCPHDTELRNAAPGWPPTRSNFGLRGPRGLARRRRCRRHNTRAPARIKRRGAAVGAALDALGLTILAMQVGLDEVVDGDFRAIGSPPGSPKARPSPRVGSACALTLGLTRYISPPGNRRQGFGG